MSLFLDHTCNPGGQRCTNASADGKRKSLFFFVVLLVVEGIENRTEQNKIKINNTKITSQLILLSLYPLLYATIATA